MILYQIEIISPDATGNIFGVIGARKQQPSSMICCIVLEIKIKHLPAIAPNTTIDSTGTIQAQVESML